MKQKKKICLLLTGCVRPNIEGDCVAVADVRLRRRQYVEAITWYLDHTPYDVVFCENSNTDLSDEFHGRKDAARLEVLTYFKGGGETRSKGYKEMEILEYIHLHSLLAAKADMLVKVTGRLVLLNVRQLAASLQGCKGDFVSLLPYLRRRYCDSRFIFFTPRFFPLLLAEKEHIDGWPNNFEMVTLAAIDAAKQQGIRFVFPHHAQRVHGVSGGFGYSYDLTPMQHVKAEVWHQMKRVLFAVGILPRYKGE